MTEKPLKITKNDMVRNLAAGFDLSLNVSREIVDSLFSSVAGAVRHGGIVSIRGFGRFQLKTYGGFERGGKTLRRVTRLAFTPADNQRFLAE